METNRSNLIQFIESFAHHSATRDFAGTVAQFAESFLVAGPAGAQCIRAADFGRALPCRAELFDSLGRESTELIEVQDSWIDARYAVARTIWRFTFRRSNDAIETVDSESIFVVDTGSDPFRILMYLNPSDIMETLRQRGIFEAPVA